MTRRAMVLAAVMCLLSLPGQVVSAQASIVHNMVCTVAHGYTMQEVLEVARSIDFDQPDGPNFVFFRQAITGNGNVSPNSFVFATRWADMEHWARSRASRARSPQGALMFQMTDCDWQNSWISLDYTVDEGGSPYEGGELNASLVYFRTCDLREGRTVQDFVDRLAQGNARFREAGDRSIMQVSRRWLGSREGVSPRQVGVRVVGENAEGLARRLDMSVPTGPPQNSQERVVENCNRRMLMWSHVVHWSPPS